MHESSSCSASIPVLSKQQAVPAKSAFSSTLPTNHSYFSYRNALQTFPTSDSELNLEGLQLVYHA